MKHAAKVRLRLGDRTLTPEEVLALVAKDRDQAEKLARGGVKIEASQAVLDHLRATAIGEHIGDDGEVTVSALGPGAVVAIFIAGFALGFMAGADFATAAADSEDKGANGNGDTDAGGEGNGEQNGGDSEGPGD